LQGKTNNPLLKYTQILDELESFLYLKQLQVLFEARKQNELGTSKRYGIQIANGFYS